MNYQEYRSFKESLDLSGMKRLDCMNPFKAMAFIQPSQKVANKSESKDYILDLVSCSEKVSFTSGVRAALEEIFRNSQGETLYLPNEVYPVYFDLVSASSKVLSYSIFNELALQDIRNSTVLYTYNNFGEIDLGLVEAEELIARGNKLIIDAVYDYEQKSNKFIELCANGQCFVLNSFSKTQLHRGFGYVIHNSNLKFTEPEQFYTFDQSVPSVQISVFEERWIQIEESLGLSLPVSRHPYFKVLDVSFNELISNDILAIPLSVFSKYKCEDKSVISCLYEIDKYCKVGAPK